MTGVPPGVAADIPFRSAPLYDAGVTIGLQTEEKLAEAEVRTAATRRSFRGEGREPRFEIESVITAQPDFIDADEWLTMVSVDTSIEMLSYKDVRMFHSEFGQRFASKTDIMPSQSRAAQTGQPPAKNDDVVPKLVTRIKTNRGLLTEFRESMGEMVGPFAMGEAVITAYQDDGENVGLLLGRGGTVQDWGELDRETFGPGGKSVTDISFGGIAVEKSEYEPYREDDKNVTDVDRSDLA